MSKLAILGGGNLGRALALGWVGAGRLSASDIHLTRRQGEKLADLGALGYKTGPDNRAAVRDSELVILAVQPQQLDTLLSEIAGELDASRHRLVSVVSGVSTRHIRAVVGDAVPLVLAMPNTAVAIGESMTCLSAGAGSEKALAEAEELFELVGKTLVIAEEMMAPATALCACGVAFFLRCVRAASQGGIEIGFHPEEALLLAGQTARGAASLTQRANAHPEGEIDRVTTPRGCTIAGLNEMEHRGLSSALIKGLIVSARAAEDLYED
jgi:pyrroline-5-carboxylate reductase